MSTVFSILTVVFSLLAAALTCVPLSCKDHGMYLLSHTTPPVLGVTVTYSFDIGYQKYRLSDNADEDPHDNDTLCGSPCETLSRSGVAFAAFSGLSVALHLLSSALLLFTLLCSSSSSSSPRVASAALLCTGLLCGAVGALAILGAVAAVVNGSGDEYEFGGVADISTFRPLFGAACHFAAVVVSAVAIGFLRCAGGGQEGKGLLSPSFKFAPQAKQTTFSTSMKQYGAKPKALKTQGKSQRSFV